MEDQEDVKKLTEFINKESKFQDNYQLEFEDFVNFKQDCSSDQEFDDECFEELTSDSEVDLKYSQNLERGLILTQEEQSIIDTCPDPDLKKLLILNRSKHLQLIKLHKKVQGYLGECEAEIEENRAFLNDQKSKKVNQQSSIWKLAAPYFKDTKFFTSPLNADAASRRSLNELSAYDLSSSPKWNPIEFDRLLAAVKCNFNINRQNDIVSQINALKAKAQNDEEDSKFVTERMLALKERLEEVKNDNEVPQLGSNDFINWYKVSEAFSKEKHTPTECQAVWHTLVHPDINKSEFDDVENRRIEHLAKKHKCQNWDEVAKELGTKRTGFTVCLHYFSKLCEKFKRAKFTPEEDQKLLEVVATYKNGDYIPWHKVVWHFDKRSRHQLYHRYTYFLSQINVKKGKFSEAEDILLLVLVHKFGRNFKKCAEYVPHRSQIQLKSRYNCYLERHMKKGSFSAEEDQLIYEHAQKNGEKVWADLARQMNRSSAQVRQRYKVIKTYLKESFDDIPKRKQRIDPLDEDQYNFLNYMAAQFYDWSTIPTIETIERSLKSASQFEADKAGGADIDELLTALFRSGESTQGGVVTEATLSEASSNVEQVLQTLGVKLDIPKVLECDSFLDNIDIEILERLRGKESSDKIEQILPPNLSTLIGLRTMIIQHKQYKTQKKDRVMSDQPKEEIFHQKKPPEASNKRVSREDAAERKVVKKRRVSVSALTNLKQHPQLKLVDRKVVEELMKKRNINVIKITSVMGSDGVTKPVLASNPLLERDVTEDDDSVANDVEALNVILKRVKSEMTTNAEDLTNGRGVRVKPEPGGF